MNGRDAVEQFIRSTIFGMEDGLVSMWGLILGVSVGTHEKAVIILAGLAGMLPAALSMAAGEYLSSKSKRELQDLRLKEEEKLVRKHKKKAIEELRKEYLDEGFVDKDIRPLLNAMRRSSKLLLAKLSEERGTAPEYFERPLLNSAIMFGSFVFASMFPLLPFFLLSLKSAVIISPTATIIALFVVGALKTRFTRKNWLRSGTEMLFIGGTAAIFGYLVGILVSV